MFTPSTGKSRSRFIKVRHRYGRGDWPKFRNPNYGHTISRPVPPARKSAQIEASGGSGDIRAAVLRIRPVSAVRHFNSQDHFELLLSQRPPLPLDIRIDHASQPLERQADYGKNDTEGNP
jgi:hypothetical protein